MVVLWLVGGLKSCYSMPNEWLSNGCVMACYGYSVDIQWLFCGYLMG
jgi:hypothetical protein